MSLTVTGEPRVTLYVDPDPMKFASQPSAQRSREDVGLDCQTMFCQLVDELFR